MFRDETKLETKSFRWNSETNCLEQMITVIQHHNTDKLNIGIYREWKVVMVDGLPVNNKDK